MLALTTSVERSSVLCDYLRAHMNNYARLVVQIADLD